MAAPFQPPNRNSRSASVPICVTLVEGKGRNFPLCRAAAIQRSAALGFGEDGSWLRSISTAPASKRHGSIAAAPPSTTSPGRADHATPPRVHDYDAARGRTGADESAGGRLRRRGDAHPACEALRGNRIEGVMLVVLLTSIPHRRRLGGIMKRWQRLFQTVDNPYRPELDYMRGPARNGTRRKGIAAVFRQYMRGPLPLLRLVRK